MLNLKWFETNTVLLLRKGAFSILIGVVGSTLMVMFLTTFLTLTRALGLLPWIIGFNTAMTGFSLIDKTRDALQYRRLVSMAAGILNTVLTLGLLTGLSLYMIGIELFGLADWALLSTIGGLCSGFGAWLAIRYYRIKK